MSWHCSLVEGEDFSLASYLAGIQSARVKSEKMLETSYCNDKETEYLSPSLSGMTLAPSTASHGEEKSTSLAGDSPARILAPQEKEKALPESVAVFGKSMRELLERLNLTLSSRKTVRYLELEDLQPSSKTLPSWGMTADGVCWELGTSAKYIEETVCGLLPTPSGVNGGKNHIAGRLDEWGGSSNPFRKTPIGNVHCPRFEEWMMGWPETWAALTGFEMDKFQLWLQTHGLCLVQGYEN